MIPADTRKTLGLSIADMARALNIHRSTWVKWEREEQRPPAVAETAMQMLLFLQSKNQLEQWQSFVS